MTKTICLYQKVARHKCLFIMNNNLNNLHISCFCSLQQLYVNICSSYRWVLCKTRTCY